ncbi:MAG TPA: DUF2961 domain-containing protein [Candidatus Hydrogenedentes bacterium]|nr:DUF2961 domain-containing protein [Candidatus Hydrogenedentota bacterium]HPG67672.1 DUF2961 domain-containing protein [Candidatus Hydrogenedentota bacterium]
MNRVGLLVLCSLVGLGTAASAQITAGDLDALIRHQDYEARRESSSSPDLNANGDARSIPAGGTLVLADIDGPGIITQFWHTAAAYDPFYGRSLVLRIYYDGNERPSVLTPLGDFFAEGHGNLHTDFSSAPVVVTGLGRSRTCFWRMPFKNHLKMTVTNDSTEEVDSFYYHLNWRKLERLPDDTPYFHAHYRQEFPAKPGHYTVLDTKGRGHYVGTVYSAHQVEMGWYGEGDDFFYIDGAETPQLRGTGTEEYFLDAWGFREYTSPYAGVTAYEGVLPGDRVTVYRWHIPDPIPFRESLRFVFEHKGSVFNEKGGLTNLELGSFIERPDWLSSVAFWYQQPIVGLDEDLPPADQRIAPYRVIDPGTLTRRADPPLLVMASELGLSYVPNKQEAAIEIDFTLDEPGRYQISGIFMYGIIAGIYQAYLDGKRIGGPIDFVIVNYSPGFALLDTHDLEAGTHTLRFESVPGDPAVPLRQLVPSFNGFHIVRLILLRLEDMAGYHEVYNQLVKPK